MMATALDELKAALEEHDEITRTAVWHPYVYNEVNEKISAARRRLPVSLWDSAKNRPVSNDEAVRLAEKALANG